MSQAGKPNACEDSGERSGPKGFSEATEGLLSWNHVEHLANAWGGVLAPPLGVVVKFGEDRLLVAMAQLVEVLVRSGDDDLHEGDLATTEANERTGQLVVEKVPTVEGFVKLTAWNWPRLSFALTIFLEV